KHRNRTWPDIRGVPASVIGSDSQHMRLGTTGWNLADDLQPVGIDNRYAFGSFGRHIEEPVLGAENRVMGPTGTAKIERIDDLFRRQVDHIDKTSVCARPSHAGISENRHKGPLTVGRSCNLVSCIVSLPDGGNLLSLPQIDDAKCLVALIRYQQ